MSDKNQTGKVVDVLPRVAICGGRSITAALTKEIMIRATYNPTIDTTPFYKNIQRTNKRDIYKNK